MELDFVAMEALNHLTNIFQDNQNACVVTLEKEISNTCMEYFPNVSSYCQRLKILFDQLRNVGSSVNNHRLAFQLIYGLPKAYHIVSTLIRQSNPIPAFYQVHSMLTLKEAGMTKMTTIDSHSAMHTSQQQPSEDTSQHEKCLPGNRARSSGNQGRGGR